VRRAPIQFGDVAIGKGFAPLFMVGPAETLRVLKALQF